MLHVEAANSPTLAQIAGEIPLDEFKARFQAFPNWREKIIDEAGHMVHHDQPEQVAALIEGSAPDACDNERVDARSRGLRR